MNPVRIHLASVLFLVAMALSAQQPGAQPWLQVMGITVSGNKVTKERIILREMLVHEGDSLPASAFYDQLERSRQNLMNTGLFNTVTLLPVYLDLNKVFIEVQVNERWYLWPALVLELADPNFNTFLQFRDLGRVNYGLYLNQYNFRGRNESIYALVQLGYTRKFAMRYKAPFIDKDQRWGFSIGAAVLQQAEITTGTVANERILVQNPDGSNRDEWKADLEVTLRRKHDVRHAWRVKFVDASVTDTIVAVAPNYFDGPSRSTRFLSLGYTFIWDHRDARIFPRQGQYGELRVDRHGIGLLSRSAPNITTAYATYKHWWKLHDKWTFALSLRGKRSFGIPSYYIQEGLGYGNHVRGFEYYVIDGEDFVLGKGNVIFQLLKPRTSRVEAIPLEAFRTLYFALYLNLFADAGRVWDSLFAEQNFLANQWMGGYGAGLDLVTSYDQVVRIEYSFNSISERGLFLHFSQPF